MTSSNGQRSQGHASTELSSAALFSLLWDALADLLADNVIQLKYIELEGRLERGISVLKVRGARHSTDVRRMSLEGGGIEIGSPFKGLHGVLTGLPVRSGGAGAGEP